MSGETGFPRAWHVGARPQRKRGEVVTTYEILDNNGSVVAELPEGVHSHREQSANADLICNAVNRIDYMRDLARRLADIVNEASFFLNNKGRDVLREARYALGEDASAQ